MLDAKVSRAAGGLGKEHHVAPAKLDDKQRNTRIGILLGLDAVAAHKASQDSKIFANERNGAPAHLTASGPLLCPCDSWLSSHRADPVLPGNSAALTWHSCAGEGTV